MSRNRVGSVKASAAENEQMSHLWHSLVDTLRLLPSVPTNPSTLKHSSSASDEDKARDLRTMQKEKKTLDEALEKLSVLIALRRGSSVPPDGGSHGAAAGFNGSGSTYGVSTPGGSGTGAGGIKRKRKLSVGPGSGSASPAPHGLHPGSHLHGGRDHALSPTPGYVTTKAGTPMSREATGKHKRDIYSDQLPLQPGRKVAFKLPRSKANDGDNGHSGAGGAAGAVGGGTGGDDWILAVVARCIQQDKMRYEVTDIEDTSAAYNTTLRSIIPLPDPDSPSHLSSHPSNLEDYGRGSQVLALYPDTTSFYRATVMAPPLPGTGNGLGIRSGSGGGGGEMSSKKGFYRLMFVDDDDNIQDVHKDFVVAVSVKTLFISILSLP
ncbi:SAGA-associated factor 29 [Kwoniella heveanensis BCC8398]|uniref:SAGA-associated factor 29 n=1 Tax=Kwoniella heveanensis BCC8398 TaxID=1296120 RepID=A0A1B9H253_9TREE|nr:SAGA-associated factor 29 [Kwoniella heveanensis BCC8398]